MQSLTGLASILCKIAMIRVVGVLVVLVITLLVSGSNMDLNKFNIVRFRFTEQYDKDAIELLP